MSRYDPLRGCGSSALETGTIRSMSSSDRTATVLVYSDDANTRAQIRMAIGRRPAADLPRVEFVECATGPAVFQHLDRGGVDLVVLDAEAQPEGGLGIARQAKDEIYDCPPLLAIIARRDDGWLATWSRADAVVSQPLDPMALASAVAELMRRRAGSGLAVQ
jgi:DNA-binding response OmpR family regulator